MPTTTTYKLGRDCVAELPGMSNDDIIDVTINVTADQLDVTVFKSTPLTQWEYMAGLIEITIDVTCTNVDGAVGDVGTYDVAGLPADLEACILEIKEKPTPKGKVEYTVSYGLQDPEASA
jgi:hypothetical protein